MRLVGNLRADIETGKTTFTTRRIIDVPAMTQDTGGGRVKRVITWREALQNITCRQHPVRQMVR